MRSSRLLLTVLLSGVAPGVSAWADDRVRSQATIPATIFGVEMGDCGRLFVKGDRGVSRSFFIGRTSGMLQQIVDRPDSFKGCTVALTW